MESLRGHVTVNAHLTNRIYCDAKRTARTPDRAATHLDDTLRRTTYRLHLLFLTSSETPLQKLTERYAKCYVSLLEKRVRSLGPSQSTTALHGLRTAKISSTKPQRYMETEYRLALTLEALRDLLKVRGGQSSKREYVAQS